MKIMRLMNRITTKAFILLFFIALSCLTIFTSIFSFKSEVNTVQAAETTPVLTVTCLNIDAYDYCAPLSSGAVTFSLSLDQAPTGSVIVTFHALDVTAISQTGDYYYLSSDSSTKTTAERAEETTSQCTVSINATNYKDVTISYKVNKNTYAFIDGSNLVCNYFNFMIDSVEGAEYTGPTTYKCRMDYTYGLAVKTDGNNNYYNEWFRTEGRDTFSFGKVEAQATSVHSYNMFANAWGKSISTVYARTVQAGWGQFQIMGYMEHMDAGVYNAGDTIVSLKFGSNIASIEYLSGIGTGGVDYSNNDKFDGDFDEHVYVSKYTETEYWKTKKKTTYYHTHTWMKIPTTWGYNYSIYFYNKQRTASRWGNGAIRCRLSDDTAPELESTIVDTSKVVSDGIVRLFLRFSEPVTGTGTSINAYLQTQYGLVLRYTEGNGTNTLVYEASVETEDLLKKSVIVNHILVDSFDGTVYDLGYCWQNRSANKATIKYEAEKISCSIDLRRPQLSSAPKTDSDKALPSRQVSVTVSEMSRGRLYYCWTTEKDATYETVEDFTNVINGPDTTKYAGYYTIKSSDGITEHTISIGSPTGLNGEYYLYLLAISDLEKSVTDVYGKVSGSGVESGYRFDNCLPTFNISASANTEQFVKIYDFTANDDYTDDSITSNPAGLSTIGVKVYDSSNPTVITDMVLWSETDNVNYIEGKASLDADGALQGSFNFDINKTTMMLSINGKDLCQLNEIGYGTYYYCFYCIDKAGNTTLLDPAEYKAERYDNRALFKCKWTANKDNLYDEYNGTSTGGIEENVYDINDIGGTNFKISFTDEDDLGTGVVKTDVMSIYKVYYGSKSNLIYNNGVGSYSDYLKVTEVTNNEKTNLDITPLKAGFYRIEFVVNRTLNSGSSTLLYTVDDYEFYFTDHSVVNGEYHYESTANYLNTKTNINLINKVFQINNSFHYMSDTEQATYVSYNNCLSPASFSSVQAATNYLKYMEYQDIQLCVIDSQMAAFLNSNSGSAKFQKADGQDAITAVSGQTWLRYKRSGWTENSSTEGWAYYYYSSRVETTINVSNLSSNCPLLISALDVIVDTYIKKGSWVYLTEESYLNKNNCPTLDALQLHYNQESVSKTVLGYPFTTLVTYEGDNGLYTNNTVVGGENYVMANNMILSVSDVTKLYFVKETAGQYSLVPLEITDGETLIDAIKEEVGSSIVRLVEFDGVGVCEYDVVIDVDAPVLRVTWITTGNSLSKTATTDFNQGNDGTTYSAKVMQITTSTNGSEYDSLAYVAVYSYPADRFISLTYYRNLDSNPIVLEDGNYYVKVGDRNGNVYKFVVQVTSEPLEVTVEVIDNNYVSVKTNRTEDQIERFEVRCNNVLCEEEYNAKGNKYTQDGYYNIFIKDIYGYTNSTDGQFGENCLFSRPNPSITWYYFNDEGAPVAYVENATTAMSITDSGDGRLFYINTSRWLRFVFTGDYEYEITGIEDGQVVASSTSHYVNIETNDNWTMKIWYKQYPDVVATYVCTCDTQAPSIHCSYKVSNYELEEQALMNETALVAEANSFYYPSSVLYVRNGYSTNNISNGEYIDTNLITLTADDESGMSAVYVYLNGDLYKEYSGLDGEFSGCSLSRSGSYKIIAVDSFGNQKVLSFFNEAEDPSEASVDDEVITKGTTKSYGHNSFSLTLKQDCLVLIKVEDYFLYYTYQEGKLYFTNFVCEDIEDAANEYLTKIGTKTILNSAGQKEVVDNVFFDMIDSQFAVNTEYEFIANNLSIEEIGTLSSLKGVHLFISYDVANNLTLKFYADEDKEVNVAASVVLDYYKEPAYYTATLSKSSSDLAMETVGGVKIDAVNNTVVRTNEQFDFSKNVDYTDIKSIRYSYSSTKEFLDYTTIYEDGKKVASLETTDNGFYQIELINKFGNLTTYIINRSDVYTILAFAVYEDYEESSFDSTYGEQIIKANSKIRFEAYADLDDKNTFTIVKDGNANPIDFDYTYDEGCYSFTIVDEGSYELTAIDNYGNKVVKKFEIKKSNIKYNDAYLTGFNQKAILLNQGYTNQKLTVDEASLQADDIKYVSTLIETSSTDSKGYKVITKLEKIYYNELTQDVVGKDAKYALEVTRVYTYYGIEPTLTAISKKIVDIVTGEELAYDVEENKNLLKNDTSLTTKFENLIGIDGDNTYDVIFRDSYGSIAKKEIHYQAASTLTISRQTRSESKATEYSIKEAINNGIYSNGTVKFESTSKNFVATKTVNGVTENVTNFPVSFGFSAENGSGTFDHALTYLDEYGNEYSFAIHLVRRELTLYIDESVDIVTIDNVETTKDNIKCSFSTNAYCVYRLDSGEEMTYSKGETLYKDGLYRFTVYDNAGNIYTKIIEKDTVCEYKFSVGTTGKTLINGDVVNSGTVKFESTNGDSTFISRIYHNNTLINDEMLMFSKDGKWSILIEDAIGNKELFEFTIITHKISHIEYETPGNYFITEFWYDSGDGVLIDSLDLVNQNENNSSFNIKDDGTYTVVMASSTLQNTIDFVFTVDTSIPDVTLEGCNEGERTNADVTFKGCNKGDTIQIYKDGELDQTIEIEESSDVPTITDGGTYTVVVTNEAGVSTTLNFTRNHLPNAAGSALILAIFVLYVVGIMIGTIIHNRQKVDD